MCCFLFFFNLLPSPFFKQYLKFFGHLCLILFIVFTEQTAASQTGVWSSSDQFNYPPSTLLLLLLLLFPLNPLWILEIMTRRSQLRRRDFPLRRHIMLLPGTAPGAHGRIRRCLVVCPFCLSGPSAQKLKHQRLQETAWTFHYSFMFPRKRSERNT